MISWIVPLSVIAVTKRPYTCADDNKILCGPRGKSSNFHNERALTTQVTSLSDGNVTLRLRPMNLHFGFSGLRVPCLCRDPLGWLQGKAVFMGPWGGGLAWLLQIRAFCRPNGAEPRPISRMGPMGPITGFDAVTPKMKSRAAIVHGGAADSSRKSLSLAGRRQRLDGFGLGFVVHAGEAKTE